MSKKKAKRVDIKKIRVGRVVWSTHFEKYVKFIGCDFEAFDNEYIFEFLDGDGFCILEKSELLEPPSLIKELL